MQPIAQLLVPRRDLYQQRDGLQNPFAVGEFDPIFPELELAGTGEGSPLICRINLNKIFDHTVDLFWHFQRGEMT